MAAGEKQPEKIQLKVHGTVETVPRTKLATPTPETPVVRQEFATATLSRARGDGQVAPVDAAPDDVVEVVTEQGLRFWTRAGQLQEIVTPRAPRGAEIAGLEIGPDALSRDEARGTLGKVVLKTLRFFHVDVAEQAAPWLAGKWEERTVGLKSDRDSAVLRRCTASLPSAEKSARKILFDESATGAVPDDRPVLLFLHGTASSTAGSFGELWDQPDLIAALFDKYKQQVFALEHRTLTASPVQNAIELVRSLPKGARLHLVSHSRGGLVGELLCRGGREGEPFDAADLQGWDDGRGSLADLNTLLQDRRLKVERFVRVACPVRGTNLLSQRLDIYLSVLFNLLEIAGRKVPVLGQALDVFSELVIAIAKERSDPAVLPGLDAMVPGSPLVGVLNRPGVTVPGEMRVIAGDIEGGDLGSLFATLLTDPLYQDAHDLVVNTDAMLGGADRTGGQAWYFERGPAVSHFRYFQNTSTSSRLLQALTRAPEAKDDFEDYRQAEAAKVLELKLSRGDGKPRHAVIVLPGISGSHLKVGGNRVWAAPGSLVFGGLANLSVGGVQAVAPDGLVAASYNQLCNYLAQDFDVIPWPYDWRLSIRKAAALLASKVEELLDDPQRKGLQVSFLAHSMGGLVVRALIAEKPALWDRLTALTAAPLVMLGTPNAGSHAMALLLLGRDKLIRQLALVDVRHSQRELLEIFGGFPGVLELLPESCFAADKWSEWRDADGGDQVKWPLLDAGALAEALKARESIAGTWNDAILGNIRYVAGRADATPVEIKVEGKKIAVLATAEGDGRVTWESTRHPKLQTWYVDAVHGDLADAIEAFPGYADLLREGKTTRLSQSPPARRGLPDRFELPPEPPPLFPDEAELLRAGLGGGRRRRKALLGPRATVSVMHGNLAFARYPIMVGHYKGDTLVSAEAALDRALAGRLSRRQRLGLYPGAVDTCDVFLDEVAAPPGALVIGLGQVGSLDRLSLVRAVRRGASDYALAVLETRGRKVAGEIPLGIGLSALLIGTGAGGLNLVESVEAILRGVALANDTLANLPGDRVRIEAVELIELYEDRAIQAAKALGNLARDAFMQEHFMFEAVPQVKPCTGGRRRAFYEEDPNWWRRLQIGEEKGSLKFTNLTDRAAAPAYTSRLHDVDEFVRDLTARTASNAETAIALYEMLVPHELKEHARERGNLVLVLDEQAARYPWELMREKALGGSPAMSGQDLPLAVESGMVRQLAVERFRAGTSLVTGNTAFVVGDPPTHLAALPGARSEARKIEEKLKASGFEVTPLIRRDDQPDTEIMDQQIRTELFVKSFRIIHLAGHGESWRTAQAEGKVQESAGMVIGRQRWLTVDDIEHLRPVPELVFVNCCYLGEVDRSPRDFVQLAANLGTALIEIGVKIVVAAGWAVEDEAARQFAETFYDEILHGTTFGDAVRRAREVVYTRWPSYNTWGAYQCYGDPGYRMIPPRADGAKRTFSFSSWAEPVVELENLVGRIKNTPAADLARIAEEIDAIKNALTESWAMQGEVCAALGAVYGELGNFRAAVEQYERALKAEDGNVSVHAVQQLCNLEARLAASTFLAGNVQDPAKLEESIDRAADRLAALVTLHETSELRSLQASVAKRRAMIIDDADKRRKSLEVMLERYGAASAPSRAPGSGTVDPYPLVNFLAAQVLLHGPRSRTRPSVTALLDRAVQAAKERDQKEPAFWNAVTAPDCSVVKALWNGVISATEETEIIESYRRALTRSGSPRERGSITEHLAFLQNAVLVWQDKKAAAAAAESLGRIRDAVARQ